MLSNKSARYVEVIHTNSQFLGIKESVGHVDFYFNGGITQLGCSNTFLTINMCSHLRSFEYFAESLYSKIGFYGKKCINNNKGAYQWCNISHMGGVKDKIEKKGQYFITTNSNYPFAKEL